MDRYSAHCFTKKQSIYFIYLTVLLPKGYDVALGYVLRLT